MRVHPTFTLLAIAVVGTTTGFGAAQAVGGSDQPTRGRVPPSAEGGFVDPNRMPDFIETLDRDGNVVGYSRRDDIMPTPGPSGPDKMSDASTPVFGDDLKTIVGHMYPGYGFVALGEKPATEPE